MRHGPLRIENLIGSVKRWAVDVFTSNRRLSSQKRAKNLTGVEPLQKQAQRGSTKEIQQGKIIEWLWHLKKKGLSENSIYIYGQRIQQLAKQCNVLDPEAVKEIIAMAEYSATTKAYDVIVYSEFLKWLKIEWDAPIYKRERKIPFIPLESELNELIAATGPKTSTFLRLLKETGMRRGEAERLRWVDFDFERKIVQVNNPEKGSNPRILPISNKLIGMLQTFQRRKERVFSSSIHNVFYRQKKRIAKKLGNPRVLEISLHTFRHFKGTMLYHQTHDPIHVQRVLGHRDIKSTMLYIQIEENLFQNQPDEFHTATAATVKDACKLIEVGFEYVTEISGTKIFRKRK